MRYWLERLLPANVDVESYVVVGWMALWIAAASILAGVVARIHKKL